MVSTLTLNFFLSLIRGNFGDLSNPGLINFGKFVNVTYKVYELPIFLIMGAFGGLVGALFNYLNIKLTKLRGKYIKRPIAKVCETLLIASFSAVIGFLLSFYLNPFALIELAAHSTTAWFVRTLIWHSF